MSRRRDPAWLALAEWVYAASLHLYPRELRQAHGEQMRQAFRDRCRELAGGGSAWRLFALELIPDFFSSVSRAQFDAGFGGQQRRSLAGLGLLCILALTLLTQQRWSGAFLDGTRVIQNHWAMAREAREHKRHEAAMLELVSTLVERKEPQAQALAAYLQRSLYSRQSWHAFADEQGPYRLTNSAIGERATALAAPLLATAPDLYTLSLAVQACSIESGCNRDLAIGRLLARDPDNAFGWMLEFKRAASLGQSSRMQAAIDGIGRARYFENHQGRIERDLFAVAHAVAPDDAGLLADVADQARHAGRWHAEDFRNDLRVQCSLRQPTPPRLNPWVKAHPESRASCIHLAALLAASTDVDAGVWGWRQLLRANPTPSAAALSAWREREWLMTQDRDVGIYRGPDGRSWRPWTDASWRIWAASWKAGDGQVTALRRWLAATGRPTRAPADFRPPPI